MAVEDRRGRPPLCLTPVKCGCEIDTDYRPFPLVCTENGKRIWQPCLSGSWRSVLATGCSEDIYICSDSLRLLRSKLIRILFDLAVAKTEFPIARTGSCFFTGDTGTMRMKGPETNSHTCIENWTGTTCRWWPPTLSAVKCQQELVGEIQHTCSEPRSTQCQCAFGCTRRPGKRLNAALPIKRGMSKT